jgi:hypothetical protein
MQIGMAITVRSISRRSAPVSRPMSNDYLGLNIDFESEARTGSHARSIV